VNHRLGVITQFYKFALNRGWIGKLPFDLEEVRISHAAAGIPAQRRAGVAAASLRLREAREELEIPSRQDIRRRPFKDLSSESCILDEPSADGPAHLAALAPLWQARKLCLCPSMSVSVISKAFTPTLANVSSIRRACSTPARASLLQALRFLRSRRRRSGSPPHPGGCRHKRITSLIRYRPRLVTRQVLQFRSAHAHLLHARVGQKGRGTSKSWH
jgi:hypothetical protein